MRNGVLCFLAIVGIAVAGLQSPSAAPMMGRNAQSTGASMGLVVEVSDSRYCQSLRTACVYKEELGETGEGNCRRYRSECGGGNSYCERLRRACVYKDERGEVGEGNCRRYRSECGGWW